MTDKKKLIEVALPLDAINRESAREKSIRHGHPSTLHLWWARRPLAAARAVLWASLVDDPSSDLDAFPTFEAQEEERQRLFRILEALVKWDNTNNEAVLQAARKEILASCAGDLPRILDPFCGGGTIPLEAQRLGLPAYAGDLNPIPVTITRAMVEIPPRFANARPVNPDGASETLQLDSVSRASGLAEDIRYYGRLMQEYARKKLEPLYPTVRIDGEDATVIAWIWARTVMSPDPSWEGHVPLVRSWVLRKVPKKPVTWVSPTINRETGTIHYSIQVGGDPPVGTVSRQGAVCLATGTPIPFSYVRSEAKAGRMRTDLIAVVAEGKRGRRYLQPDEVSRQAATKAAPPWQPSTSLPDRALGFRVQAYGMTTHASLFTERQLTALATYFGTLQDIRDRIVDDATTRGFRADDRRFSDGGQGPTAYADAVITYLAFAVDKGANYWSTICAWHASREIIVSTFARQAIPMVWDFAEANPLSGSSGNFLTGVDQIARVVESLPAEGVASVEQRDALARVRELPGSVISTDPPYYDNIGYADLSDFFYVWMRAALRDVWPNEFSTVLTPKAEELIASPFRHGSREAADRHFEHGMVEFFAAARDHMSSDYPMTIFYAFKQSETDAQGTASTGWEVFLEGIIRAGLTITATWPVRTEYTTNLKKNVSALASSVVLACRRRDSEAPMATGNEFLAALRAELPSAVRLLQKESIAPVDMAQAAIGPGMAIFSRYAKIIEADGSIMTIRRALISINEVLQEVLSQEETEFDGDTRWALTWYEQNGLNPGSFGDAETLSKAKNTSVSGVIQAGIAVQLDGKVRLLNRNELTADWDPASDPRLTVWEVAQHLIASLSESESAAADLLRRIGGGLGERSRQLAYLLFQVADRRGWADETLAYNGLVLAWPEISRLAGRAAGPVQQILGE